MKTTLPRCTFRRRRPRGDLLSILLLPLCAALVVGSGITPESAVAQEAPRSVAGGPEGTGVYTKEQAQRGRRIYDVDCLICHAPREFSGALFERRWLTPPLSGLFVHIMHTMPQDMPGSLEPEQVAALLAYILELNGQPAGPEPLPTETEKLVQLRVGVAPDSSHRNDR